MGRFFSTVLAGSLLSLVLVVSGCDTRQSDSSSPASTESSSQDLNILGKSDSRVKAVMAVQDRHTARLMSMAGVVGTATGLSADGDVVVKIYTAREGVRGLPTSLDGIKVEVEVTGEFRSLGRPGGGGGGGGKGDKISHTALQTPPILLGTSGGWGYDLANGFCCGGTLGSLVNIGGTQYILSNYHVFNADIVPGGNGIVATDGSPVIQPGLIDVGCNFNNAQTVATLADASNASLPGSNVDAAIAQVVSGMVSSTGEILEVGTISSSIVDASLNQAVKKSGRTTGLTRSKISGLNATVNVAYDNECAGDSAFVKTYSGQIIVTNRGSKFLAGGDSGSLMVEDASTNPRAVGLLYAGSSTSGVANPIGEVLGHFNATMVGN